MKHTFNTIRTELVTPVRLSHVGGWTDNPSGAICNEMQFFNATPAMLRSYQKEAPITWYLLQKYFRDMFDSDEYYSLLINTYGHQLTSAGMYPNQPIWHCDYARREIEEGATIVEEDEQAIHWYIILGDKPSVPMPQFIDKHNISLQDEILSEDSWTGVSRYIDRKVKSGWHTFAFKPFELFKFRGNELYRSSITTEPVNRFAMRVTWYPEGHPYRPTGNGKGKERRLHTVYFDC